MTSWMPKFHTLLGSMSSVPCAEACRLVSARTPDIERGSVRAVPYLYRYGTRHTPHHGKKYEGRD